MWSSGVIQSQGKRKRKKRKQSTALTTRRGGRSPPLPPRVVEYIKVPKHWFTDPLQSAMSTTVRPPTAMTRRKQLKIEMKVPEDIFLDMMQPFNDDDMKDFQWITGSERRALQPTKVTQAYKLYKYVIKKPSLVDKLWRLEENEAPRKAARTKGGQLVPYRRGHGSSKLHLSQAAAKRGELTNLIAGVTGNVVIQLKVSNMLRAMPLLTLQYAISSMDKRGHILWPTTYEVRTAAALRKQLRFHLKTMMESDEYPTLEQMTPSLTASSETLLQLK